MTTLLPTQLNIRSALAWASTTIHNCSPTARLDAELLLAHILGWGRARLLAEGNMQLSQEAIATYQALVERRLNLEPVAYIVGQREFYGLDFYVDARVLVPRPETELLVELAISWAGEWDAGVQGSEGAGDCVLPAAMPASSVSSNEPGAVHDQRLQLQDGLNQASSACSQKYTQDRSLLVTYPSSLSSAQNTKHKAQNFLSVADICTGSGCIAIALAKYLPQAHIFATDISSEALELAAHNVMRHDVTQQVQLLQGDLLDVLPQAVNLLVSNPPYTMIDSIDEGVRRHEPRLALDGGPDGLELYRRLLAAAPGRINAGGAILLEIGAEQGQAVQMLARAAFPQAEISIHPDLAGHDRVVRILLG